MEIRRFCLLRKTAGFLLQKYFSFEIPDRNRQQLLEKMQLCKKIPLKYWTLYLIHKALNHESFCKQKHYHKLRLTDHCWFKWQPFLAMSQSARQESCSTQVTSGHSMVLQSLRAPSLAETMAQLSDGEASFILIPPTCATTKTCVQKL